MNKKIIKKIFLIMLITIGIIFAITIKSNAANLSISTSKSSVSPGETFTVTVTLNGGAGPISASASNGSGSGSQWLENSSLSFSCTAGNSGTVSIYASGTVGDFATEEDVKVSNSKNVTIVQPETKPETSTQSKPSNNNQTTKPSTNTSKPTKTETTTTKTETKKSTDSSLAVLAVEEGTISPEFSKDIKEYTMEVPNEVTVLNITATPNDSNAKVEISGNLELIEGENTVTVTVVAEDGSKTDYIIKVTRSLKELSLDTLTVKYENQEGELIETSLNPIFSQDTLEYTMQNLEYWVKKLKIEALANREGATIEIEGADNLVEGENIITITVKMPVTAEEGIEASEETKIYTIKVIKDAEPAPPTVMAKISDWYNNNQDKIVFTSLMVAIVLLLVLSIFIITDYKKYQAVLSKIAQLNNLNGVEVETIPQIENKEEISEIIEENKKNKKGKH